MKKSVLIIIFIVILVILGFLVYYYFFPKETQLPEEVSQEQKVEMIVRGDSMEPTLKDNQKVKVNLDYYKTHEVERGDVIIFKLKTIEDPMVKRIIALPGDKVEFKDGGLYINGEKLKEDYLKDINYQFSETELKTLLIPLEKYNNIVPGGSYLTLSDNRTRTIDSRKWGFLPKEYVIGKVEY